MSTPMWENVDLLLSVNLLFQVSRPRPVAVADPFREGLPRLSPQVRQIVRHQIIIACPHSILDVIKTSEANLLLLPLNLG